MYTHTHIATLVTEFSLKFHYNYVRSMWRRPENTIYCWEDRHMERTLVFVHIRRSDTKRKSFTPAPTFCKSGMCTNARVKCDKRACRWYSLIDGILHIALNSKKLKNK